MWIAPLQQRGSSKTILARQDRGYAAIWMWTSENSLPRTGVKIALGRLYFHGFGVARQGPWITRVNKDGQEPEISSTTATTAAKAKR
jgi:hypothetical protein